MGQVCICHYVLQRGKESTTTRMFLKCSSSKTFCIAMASGSYGTFNLHHWIDLSKSNQWFPIYYYLAILCNLFGMVSRDPCKWLSDLQLGDEEVIQWITWCIYSIYIPMIPIPKKFLRTSPSSTTELPPTDSWRTELPMPRTSPAKTPKPRPTSTTTWMPKARQQPLPTDLTKSDPNQCHKNISRIHENFHLEALILPQMCLDHLVLAIAICTSSSLAWLETASCGNFQPSCSRDVSSFDDLLSHKS